MQSLQVQSTTVVLPQGTYADGTYHLGPAAVPVGITGFQLALDGSQMTDPTLTITVSADLSLDGGATWASTNPGPATNPFPITAGIQGGAQNKDGTPLTTYYIQQIGIPGVANAQRMIRATVVVSGIALVTQGTLLLLQ